MILPTNYKSQYLIEPSQKITYKDFFNLQNGKMSISSILKKKSREKYNFLRLQSITHVPPKKHPGITTIFSVNRNCSKFFESLNILPPKKKTQSEVKESWILQIIWCIYLQKHDAYKSKWEQLHFLKHWKLNSQ